MWIATGLWPSQWRRTVMKDCFLLAMTNGTKGMISFYFLWKHKLLVVCGLLRCFTPRNDEEQWVVVCGLPRLLRSLAMTGILLVTSFSFLLFSEGFVVYGLLHFVRNDSTPTPSLWLWARHCEGLKSPWQSLKIKIEFKNFMILFYK